MVAAAATIASSALPPSRSTASADCAAKECGATAMPRVPRAELVTEAPGLARSLPSLFARWDTTRSVPYQCGQIDLHQLRFADAFDKLDHSTCLLEKRMNALLRFSSIVDAANERIGKIAAWFGLLAVIVSTGNAE